MACRSRAHSGQSGSPIGHPSRGEQVEAGKTNRWARNKLARLISESRLVGATSAADRSWSAGRRPLKRGPTWASTWRPMGAPEQPQRRRREQQSGRRARAQFALFSRRARGTCGRQFNLPGDLWPICVNNQQSAGRRARAHSQAGRPIWSNCGRAGVPRTTRPPCWLPVVSTFAHQPAARALLSALGRVELADALGRLEWADERPADARAASERDGRYN